jgi:hypothetical protein
MRVRWHKQALARAESVAEIREVEGMIDGFEHYMRASGRWPESEMRAITEVRVRARWKLGKLLFYTARSQGARSDRATSFPMETKSLPLRATLDATGIKPKLAHEAQKLAALPEAELDAAFADYDRESSFPSFRGLIDRARPYWYRESRLAKHQKIAGAATGRLENLGPFPLIYADPPWKFEIYSEIGAERTPDQHYPTLSDQEIIDFKVGGKPVKDIAHKDAALFLWWHAIKTVPARPDWAAGSACRFRRDRRSSASCPDCLRPV